MVSKIVFQSIITLVWFAGSGPNLYPCTRLNNVYKYKSALTEIDSKKSKTDNWMWDKYN